MIENVKNGVYNRPAYIKYRQENKYQIKKVDDDWLCRYSVCEPQNVKEVPTNCTDDISEPDENGAIKIYDVQDVGKRFYQLNSLESVFVGIVVSLYIARKVH